MKARWGEQGGRGGRVLALSGPRVAVRVRGSIWSALARGREGEGRVPPLRRGKRAAMKAKWGEQGGRGRRALARSGEPACCDERSWVDFVPPRSWSGGGGACAATCRLDLLVPHGGSLQKKERR